MQNPTHTNRQEAVALVRLGLPLAGSQIAQFLIVSSDTLMLGWYGVPELAAVTVASSYFFMFFIVAAGFAFAIMPLVAKAYEESDPVRLRRVTRMGLWLAVGVAVILLLPLWFSGPIFLLLGQEPVIAELSERYLRLVGFSLLPAMTVLVLRSYLSALERTGIILLSTIAAVGLNVLCNWLLIFGNLGFPEMGIQGAAVASLANNVLMMGILIWYVNRHFAFHELFARLWRPDWEALREVFGLGWPISLTHLFETALFGGAAIMMGWIGQQELAAHGVALQLAALTFMAHLGLSQAATVRVGQAMGRASALDVRRTGQMSLVMSVSFALLTALVFVTLPEPLLGLFLDPDEPERDAIVAIGVVLLAMAALFQIVDGAQVLGLSLLRGLEDTRVPMIYAAVSYWAVGMPASYVLAFELGWGAVGVWLGLVLGLASAAGLIMWRFWRVKAPWLGLAVN